MRHEPSALVGDPEYPVKVMGAHALLAGTEQVERVQPLIQRQVAIFKNRSNRHTELLFAGLALPHALTRVRALLGVGLHFQLGRLANGAAMGTNRVIRPSLRFQILACIVSVQEPRFGDSEFGTAGLTDGFYIGLPHVSMVGLSVRFVKYTISEAPISPIELSDNGILAGRGS